MARKGAIEIPVAVDTGGVEKSINNGLIDPIEDAEKALEALAKVDAGKDIDRDLKRAQDATEDLDDELDRTRKSLDKVGFAAKDAGRDGAAGLDKIKGGAQEVQQEIGQNLGQAVSSIRDDMSDLGQVGQDTLGGLAATLASTGPAGLAGAAVLAAGAVGLGAVTAEMQKQQEEADKLRDRLSGAYQAAAEEGRAYLDTASLIADASDLMFNPDRADEWKRLQEDANKLGLDRSVIAAANAGELSSQQQVMEAIAAATQLTKERMSELGLPSNYSASMSEIQSRWENITGETQKQIDNNRVLREVTSELNESERDQLKRTQAAEEKRYQGAADAAIAQSNRAANAAQSRYEGLAAQMAGGVELYLHVNDQQMRNAQRQFDNLRRDAERGITINMRNVNGRQIV